ncbi:hypothetical protein CP971_11855 [Streptomyces viridifaciens]|nr:hypothetical protein CP971_11855 [Streptomyces viridifaciens]
MCRPARGAGGRPRCGAERGTAIRGVPAGGRPHPRRRTGLRRPAGRRRRPGRLRGPALPGGVAAPPAPDRTQ